MIKQENYHDWVEIGQLELSDLTPEQLLLYQELRDGTIEFYNL